jgi:hypothetical protein
MAITATLQSGFASATRGGQARRVPVSGSSAGPALKLHVFNITFDASYPTGGEAWAGIAPISKVYKKILAAAPVDVTGGSRLVTFDVTNQKFKLFTAIGTEAANASDQSTITATVMCLGY